MTHKALFILPLVLILGSCDSAPQPTPESGEARIDPARQRQIDEFRTRVAALEEPDAVLALLSGHDRFSTEFEIIDGRLLALVRPQIENAQTTSELKALKKYALPGSSLMIHYLQRESELSRQQ